MSIPKRLFRRLMALQRAFMSKLPPTYAVRIDRLNPRLANSWGGPLNGQSKRREIVREIATQLPFDRVIETGTFRGASSEFLMTTFDAPVKTVEAVERYFLYSQERFADEDRIEVLLGDSRDFLRDVAATCNGETLFFYLDAHWEKDLPLRDELEIIAKTFRRAVVMIDDFRVPSDPAYSYDDYGPGSVLTVEYLPDETLTGWSILYPAAPARIETGARRGCCVLVGPDLVESFASLRTLRIDGKRILGSSPSA